jgi:hypothetical protein
MSRVDQDWERTAEDAMSPLLFWAARLAGQASKRREGDK